MAINVRYGDQGILKLAQQAGQTQDFWRRFAAEQQMIAGVRNQQQLEAQNRLEAMRLQEAAALRRQQVANTATPRRYGTTGTPLTDAVSPLIASKQAYLKSLSLDDDLAAQLGPIALDPGVDLRDFAVAASDLVKNRPVQPSSRETTLRSQVLDEEVRQINREINKLEKELADVGVNPRTVEPAALNPEIREVGGNITELFRKLPGPWQTAVATDPNAVARSAYMALEKLKARRADLLRQKGGLLGGEVTTPAAGQPLATPQMSNTDPLGILQ